MSDPSLLHGELLSNRRSRPAGTGPDADRGTASGLGPRELGLLGDELQHDGAIDLAQAVGARVTAYACLPQYPYSPFSEVVVEPPVEFQDRSEREARDHLREVEEAARGAGVACTSLTSVHPSPYLGIIEAAEQGGCDVIFMASHGRRGLGSLLIGSETQRVLTHTKIPVIVYR